MFGLHPTRARIMLRALREPLSISEPERLRILAWFKAHPESTDCYVTWRGEIVDGAKERAAMTSRRAQLLDITTKGFPCAWSRWAIENRKGA